MPGAGGVGGVGGGAGVGGVGGVGGGAGVGVGGAVASPSSAASAWSFLRSPSARDVKGQRRTRKAFDAPLKCFSHILVMDFEWTADNKPKIERQNSGAEPAILGEIIEFPAVLVSMKKWPGQVVDSFQRYVRPLRQPTLSKFIKDLTAITQEQVDAGDHLPLVLSAFDTWLRVHGLSVDVDDASCCVATWGDVDVMTVLRKDLARHNVPLPPLFRRWIDLKSVWTQHWKTKPTGGLEACVRSLGFDFEGRAHSGLVDSLNTSKIAIELARTGFRFVRATRGVDANGLPFGSREREEQQRDGEAARNKRPRVL